MEEYEFEAIDGQSHIFKCVSGISHYMALKCAVDLSLADILHAHENPITLAQLASSIDSPTPPNISALKRVMRMLVQDKIFSSHDPSDGKETLYGATKASSWLLKDSEVSLSKLISISSQPSMVTSWCYLGQCVKEGGTAFEKVHGCKFFEYASQNPEFNMALNQGMASESKNLVISILDEMKGVLKNVTYLVDVGGGIGETINAIVNENPQVNGINFDLPHVISTAQDYNGVKHIGGDMFKAIPKADAIFMKWVLHDWSDEDCLRILSNCKKAIPNKGGKIIIADLVLNPKDMSEFDEASLSTDLHMLVFTGGKERTEPEWKKLLEDGGFPRYKITHVNPRVSLIEAYPE
jgi:hypothetical protein